MQPDQRDIKAKARTRRKQRPRSGKMAQAAQRRRVVQSLPRLAPSRAGVCDGRSGAHQEVRKRKRAEQDQMGKITIRHGMGAPRAPAPEAAGGGSGGRCRGGRGRTFVPAPPKENGLGRAMASARIRQTGSIATSGQDTARGPRSTAAQRAPGPLPRSARPARQATGRNRPG
jgi:hypothetical protein